MHPLCWLMGLSDLLIDAVSIQPDDTLVPTLGNKAFVPLDAGFTCPEEWLAAQRVS